MKDEGNEQPSPWPSPGGRGTFLSPGPQPPLRPKTYVLRPCAKNRRFFACIAPIFAANFRKIETGPRTFPLFSRAKRTSETAQEVEIIGPREKTPCAPVTRPAGTRQDPHPEKIKKSPRHGRQGCGRNLRRGNDFCRKEPRPAAGNENNRPLLVSGQRVKTNFWPLSNTCLTEIGPR